MKSSKTGAGWGGFGGCVCQTGQAARQAGRQVRQAGKAGTTAGERASEHALTDPEQDSGQRLGVVDHGVARALRVVDDGEGPADTRDLEEAGALPEHAEAVEGQEDGEDLGPAVPPGDPKAPAPPLHVDVQDKDGVADRLEQDLVPLLSLVVRGADAEGGELREGDEDVEKAGEEEAELPRRLLPVCLIIGWARAVMSGQQ